MVLDIQSGLDEKGIREYLSSGEWELQETNELVLMVNKVKPSSIRFVNTFAFNRMKKKEVIYEFKVKGNIKIWRFVTKQIHFEPDMDSVDVIYSKAIKSDKDFSYLDSELKKALEIFPELKGKTIYIDVCKGGNEGCDLCAVYEKKYKLSLNLFLTRQHKNLLNTIGWGLIKVIQVQEGKPNNDKHTDIWLLARSPIFRGIRPVHIKLPEKIEQDWDTYKEQVGELCIKALELKARRKKDSHYITWLERKIEKLLEEN